MVQGRFSSMRALARTRSDVPPIQIVSGAKVAEMGSKPPGAECCAEHSELCSTSLARNTPEHFSQSAEPQKVRHTKGWDDHEPPRTRLVQLLCQQLSD
jgi:hypothetical protein